MAARTYDEMMRQHMELQAKYTRNLEKQNEALQELVNVKKAESPLQPLQPSVKPPVPPVKPPAPSMPPMKPSMPLEKKWKLIEKKRPRISGWQVFLKDKTVHAMLQNPSSLDTRLKEMSVLWKALTDEQKQVYKDKASLANRHIKPAHLVDEI